MVCPYRRTATPLLVDRLRYKREDEADLCPEYGQRDQCDEDHQTYDKCVLGDSLALADFFVRVLRGHPLMLQRVDGGPGNKETPTVAGRRLSACP